MKTSPLLRLSLAVGGLALSCGPPMTSAAPSALHPARRAVAAPSLGLASSFAVLGASTVTCTNLSTVTGDVGVSPGTAITGFNPGCTASGVLHAADVVVAQAQADATTAYGVLASAPCDHNLTGADLGNQTLAPGVYCFDSSAGLTGQLTLDAAGDANAVWIFQVASTLITATDASVLLIGGAEPCNVFWQVGSSATLGTRTALQGNVLALTSVSLVSGASLSGRAIALTAAVTLDDNRVSVGGCAPALADAGSDAGAGSTPDGGLLSDAGVPCDSGADAGVPVDAGGAADAGADAGEDAGCQLPP